jgi:hypothetical protein
VSIVHKFSVLTSWGFSQASSPWGFSFDSSVVAGGCWAANAGMVTAAVGGELLPTPVDEVDGEVDSGGC